MMHRQPHAIPTDRFWPLPRPDDAQGNPRLTGVEIEFAGLTEVQTADLIVTLWGGTVAQTGLREWTVTDSHIGDVEVTLDTTLRRHGGTPLSDKLLDWLRSVIPVEIITAPLPPDRLPQLDRLVTALRGAGASGTRGGVAYGFGVHLNPGVAAETAEFIIPVLRAYALLEDWLRATDPIDPARRLLPFVDPYPRDFIDRIAAEGARWTLEDMTRVYLALTPTRNRGLDMLPLLEHLDADTVRRTLPERRGHKGRPTFHYRLPESRVDEPAWSIAYEWNRWCLIERVAARPDLLERLATGWAAYRASLTTLRADWARQADRILAGAPLWEG